MRDEARLEALYATGLLDSPPEEAFDRLTRLVRRLLGVPVSLVSLVDADRQFFKSSTGLPEPWASLRQTPLSHSFCQHVVASQQPLVISDARAHPLVRDNLAVRDLNVIAYLGIPLRTPDGQVIGSLCAIDNTHRPWSEEDEDTLSELAALVMTEIALQHQLRERMRAKQALEEQAQALKRSNEELEQFAYIASHDLQEPLRTISSFVQLLQQRYQHRLDADADDFIAFIVDATARMQTLIEDLLAFSRVERHELRLHPIDADMVVRQVVNSMRTAIEEADAHITHAPLPMVVADKSQFHSLLHNLVSNGIKFRGDAPPQVHLSATEQDGRWCFAIRDNGIGIAKEHHDRIFKPFIRLHSRQKYAGSGIGLAICKRIVERHGGQLWVTSEPGEGATFFFTLPA